MLKWLKNRLRGTKTEQVPVNDLANQQLYCNLELNLQLFQQMLDRCFDAKYRRFDLGTEPPVAACIIYLDNMVHKQVLEEHILKPLTGGKANSFHSGENLAGVLEHSLVETVDVKQVFDLEQAGEYIFDGYGVLLVDGVCQALALKIKVPEKRAIEESATEMALRGPRDAFVEVLGINTILLRRRLKTPALKMEKLQVGRLSNTDVVVAYVESIADPEVVAEVKRRIKDIKIDGILESNYIAEFIEDVPRSPFPQINTTERPDKVAGGLLEGQVAVLVDNSPFALLMPVTFPQFLHASEDYYIRSIYATFTRLIRFVAVNIALLLPAIYIAVTTFHHELLPTSLLIAIAAGRERVPFPAFIEAFLMEATFEILREAGVRLPRPVGQATSIVGALVIGNAAVTAGLVAPAMVIVVSLTALASFIIPTIDGAFSIRILRFPIMFLAAILGFFGIIVALMAILFHLCSLRSFGVPYLVPIAPFQWSGWKDTFVRAPLWMMNSRPGFFEVLNTQRQKPGTKPFLSEKGGKE